MTDEDLKKIMKKGFGPSMLEASETDDMCKGNYYQYRKNCYRGKRGELVSKESFIPLKRMSCGGCIDCGGLPDMVEELLSEGCLPRYPKELKNGDAVLLTAVNTGRCFEDLYDEWEVEFVLVKGGKMGNASNKPHLVKCGNCAWHGKAVRYGTLKEYECGYPIDLPPAYEVLIKFTRKKQECRCKFFKPTN